MGSHVKRRPEIRVACEESNIIGESPVWSVREQALYWVDIGGQKIHRLGDGDKHSSWAMGKRVGAVGFRAEGGVVVTMPDGIYAVNLDVDGVAGTSRAEAIARPNLTPGVRMKEGKVDPAGRYWCGSTGPTKTTRDGALFSLSPAGSLRQHDDGFILVNGLAFSPDHRTMTMADSPANIVYAYDLDLGSGEVSNRREFFSTAEFPGSVDGATFDSEGYFWCAFIYDWAVARIDPTGRLDRIVRLPVRHPTMCAFGGANLDILYVTTSTSHLAEDEKTSQPQAGMLFAVHGLGVRGLPEPSFG